MQMRSLWLWELWGIACQYSLLDEWRHTCKYSNGKKSCLKVLCRSVVEPAICWPVWPTDIFQAMVWSQQLANSNQHSVWIWETLTRSSAWECEPPEVMAKGGTQNGSCSAPVMFKEVLGMQCCEGPTPHQTRPCNLDQYYDLPLKDFLSNWRSPEKISFQNGGLREGFLCCVMFSRKDFRSSTVRISFIDGRVLWR